MSKRKQTKEVKALHAETQNEFDEFELVPEGGHVWLWGYGTYPQSSVLAGQYRQVRFQHFDNLEEAQEALPGLDVREDGSINASSSLLSPMADVPPADFDPDYAGETW